MSNIELVRQRAEALNGHCPVGQKVIEELESQLGISLPDSFRQAVEFFDGSGVSVLPLHHIGLEILTNVLSETKRLRRSAKLSKEFLVLGEPPESLIVMDCSTDAGRVIWCDAVDVARLGKEGLLTAPEVWSTYMNFLEYLVSEEEADRL